jgi:hypothetical protein
LEKAAAKAAQELAEKDAEIREALATAERDATEAVAKAQKDAASRVAATMREWQGKLEEARAAWASERSDMLAEAHKAAAAAEQDALHRLQASLTPMLHWISRNMLAWVPYVMHGGGCDAPRRDAQADCSRMCRQRRSSGGPGCRR